MALAEVNGVRLHYEFEAGAAPDAPVLLFSNSLGTALAMWDGQVAAFKDRYALLRYDMRGHGASQTASLTEGMATLGKDVLGLMDQLGINRVHFCGLSMSGMLGLWLGLNAPGRLRSLCLCNTGAAIGSAALWGARIATAHEAGMAGLADGVIGRWFTAGFRAREPAAVATVRSALLATPPAGYAAACAAIRDTDLSGRLGAITLPTLVIAGSHDEATPPAAGQAIAAAIAGASYVELDTAHLSNIEDPAGFNAALARHLEDCAHG